MKTINFLTLIFAFTITLVAVSVQLIKARTEHETCFCDTCVEAHWEEIRKGNPELKMEAI